MALSQSPVRPDYIIILKIGERLDWILPPKQDIRRIVSEDPPLKVEFPAGCLHSKLC